MDSNMKVVKTLPKYDHLKIEKKWPQKKLSAVREKGAGFLRGKQKVYSHLTIEKKWQRIWNNKKVYKATEDSKKPKCYVLDMFPYPSGTGLHVGHPRGYIASDVYARFMRMKGYNVLHPMGYDAFGLPAEQYAIQHKIHPEKAVKENIETFKRQLKQIGFSYDWSREINTTDPKYYKWTQWIFLKLYNSYYNQEKHKAEPIENLIKEFCEKGSSNFSAKEWSAYSEKEKQDILMQYRLAYEGHSEVNWCPELGTVLANDEIVEKDGKQVSERGEHLVEKKSLRQWFLRITAYADRLLLGLDTIDWPDNIKEIQKNWIGKSEGAEIEFSIKGWEEKIKVFTTRADTLFGVTYVVLAPEVAERFMIQDSGFKSKIQNIKEVEAYIQDIKNKSDKDRTENKEKTGVELKGIKAINPANNEEVPVWIADYVLATYGTGMVMAVPAHDERDFSFAKKYNLPIKQVVQNTKGETVLPYTDDGLVINSGGFPWADGLLSEDARLEITEELEYRDIAKLVTKYKMRDAVFARQRYWGEPIPLIHKKDGITEPLKENKIPLKLPRVQSYEPIGTGESPLAGVKDWVKKGYETNTMPGWAGSSWYFLRYMDPKNTKKFVGEKALKYWKQVDMYVGGAEHATGHLLYSRFWNKFLYDFGLVATDEPFKVLKNQGMVLGSDSRKMSKRWGNVVNPDDVVKNVGADTLRVYESFMGPFEQKIPWSTDSMVGSRRFLERVWKLQEKVVSKHIDSDEVILILNQTIKKVEEDIQSFNANTAISAMMILSNTLESQEKISIDTYLSFIKILSPFAPHIAEEIYSLMGKKKLIVNEYWPTYDTEKLKSAKVKIVIQINGKVRAMIETSPDLDEEAVEKLSLKDKDVVKWLEGKQIKKKVFIKNKIINFVV
jgi:leucyl-tRNA synthetase